MDTLRKEMTAFTDHRTAVKWEIAGCLRGLSSWLYDNSRLHLTRTVRSIRWKVRFGSATVWLSWFRPWQENAKWPRFRSNRDVMIVTAVAQGVLHRGDSIGWCGNETSASSHTGVLFNGFYFFRPQQTQKEFSAKQLVVSACQSTLLVRKALTPRHVVVVETAQKLCLSMKRLSAHPQYCPHTRRKSLLGMRYMRMRKISRQVTSCY
jgi:hypothetical protein